MLLHRPIVIWCYPVVGGVQDSYLVTRRIRIMSHELWDRHQIDCNRLDMCGIDHGLLDGGTHKDKIDYK